MKILYHISYYKPAFVYGGPTITTANLCEGLASAGAEVTVVTTNANGKTRLDTPLNQAIDLNGVKVYYYPLGFTSKYFYSPTLLENFDAHVQNHDIVILDALMTYLLYGTSRSAQQNKKPYIIPIRGQLFPWSLEKNRFVKQIYLKVFQNSLKQAAALHCTTEEELEAIKNLGLSNPTFLLPNSMDTQAFVNLKASAAFRAQLALPQNARILLQLGRIVPIKRPDIAIDVLSQSPDDVHLILAGPCDEAYQNELKNYAQAKSCLERLHFTGLLDDEKVKDVLALSDILLMPSDIQENFGMAAAEALAAGVAVVASKNIPVAHWAAREKAAISVESASAPFTQATQTLLENENYRHQLGQAAQAFAQANLDNKAVAQQALWHYQAILDKHRKGF